MSNEEFLKMNLIGNSKLVSLTQRTSRVTKFQQLQVFPRRTSFGTSQLDRRQAETCRANWLTVYLNLGFRWI